MKAVYKILDIGHLGLHNLTVHKVRTSLTALGIIVGVMGVIATLAISEGGSYEAQLALRELGSDNIIIDSQKPVNDESKASERVTMVQSYGLTRKDVARLCDRINIPGIRTSAVVHRQRKIARVGTRNLSIVIMSTEPSYAQVARIETASGRFLCDSDLRASRPYCVITASLAQKLFLFRDPLHRVINLGGMPFLVVGTIEKLPRTLVEQAGDSDNCAIIPITADRDRFGELSLEVASGNFINEMVYASQVILQMNDEQALEDGATVARQLLARSHPTGMDYKVTIPQELLEQQKLQRRLWNIVFLAVSMISLVVGGIGIMNIMLATVTERTREIGIRRALGAKRGDIIVQFLVESVALSAVGGLLGIAFGMIVPWAVEAMFQFRTIISATTLLLPLLVALIVGLLSGLYPALRAARLDPIVALRHE